MDHFAARLQLIAGKSTVLNGAPLTADEFDRLHGELCSSKEPWQEIPWRLSLRDARAAAARANRPVYMLVRSGHPLGCV